MKRLVALTSLCLLGCQPQTQDLQAYIEQVKTNTPVNVEPLPKFETQPAYEYAAAHLRSPFQRPQKMVITQPETRNVNCRQPDHNRRKHALEKYGLDALTLAGTMNIAGTRWVLITANDGSLHKATIGDHLGLFFGEITSIADDGITITEMVPDGAGCWQTKQAKLSMPNQAGDNDDV